MSAKEGSKLLVRQISAIIITFILLWVFMRVYRIDSIVIPLLGITVSDVIVVLLALIMAGLIKGLGKPLSMIYEESIPERAYVVSDVTGHMLNLVDLAVLYIYLRGVLLKVLGLYIGKVVNPEIIYDVVFLIVGLLIVYSIIKILTR
ncbi:MAG: hypothetical protein DRO05_08645 [Thermoproteota archaeon]|nr:MAG: hypothetical protein DRO05_08645 [Candidatus Korarchaeota archaeon]